MRSKILFILFFSFIVRLYSQEFRYYEGSEEKKLYLQKDYIVDFSKQSSFTKNIDKKAKVVKQIGLAKIYLVSDPNIKNQIQTGRFSKNLKNQSQISEVFTANPQGGPKIALPGNIILAFKDTVTKSQIESFLQQRKLKVVKTLSLLNKEYYVIESSAGIASLELANQLRELPEIEYSKPDLWIEVSKR